jgi:vacuolar protein sorting-associated protein 13A/C
LEKFNLPFDVHEGYLQELTLNIPWANLKGKPVQIFINGMYLLASSQADAHYDEKEEGERQQKLKQDKLAAFEMFFVNDPATDSSTNKKMSSDSAKNESSFVSSLVRVNCIIPFLTDF